MLFCDCSLVILLQEPCLIDCVHRTYGGAQHTVSRRFFRSPGQVEFFIRLRPVLRLLLANSTSLTCSARMRASGTPIVLPASRSRMSVPPRISVRYCHSRPPSFVLL